MMHTRPFPRTAALVAGLGLLGMAVLGPLGMFSLIDMSTGAPDAATLVRPLRIALAAFVTVALLDIVVAVGLHIVFRPPAPALSRIAMILRIAYALLLGMLSVRLFTALGLVQSGAEGAAQGAVALVQSFSQGWSLSLGLFGLHLIALAAVGLKAPYLANWIAWLVGLAGLSYLVDTLGQALVPGYEFTLAAYLFFGELILMVWLLVRAFRAPRP